MPKSILWFSDTDKDDIPLVGAKAANLGELYKSLVPIPNGFIVSAPTYFDFLQQAKLKDRLKKILSKVDAQNPKLLNEISRHVKKDIIDSSIPPDLQKEIIANYKKLSVGKNALVAVRSSVTAEDLPDASFAGQQTTYLNIKGEKELLNAVRQCWASLYESRTIFYREEKGFDHFKVGIAVVVQKMIQSEASGVMFTIDPVESDKKKIIIKAVWGLGESIVQGSVNPDHYELDKKDLRITAKKISTQNKQLIKVGTHNQEVAVGRRYASVQKIANKHIKALAKLGKKIENHYGFPQDIEWALENEKIYILQTRPVTTIEKIDKSLKRPVKIGLPVILEGSPAAPGIAIGIPRVLKSAREIYKLKQGEILVASMTNPDYAPAMKKAAAIVADKGGRTSHATIVSRELGIPCIVDTNQATKVFSKNKSVITVNGTQGSIYKGALSSSKLTAIEHTQKQKIAQSTNLKTATKVFVNLGEKEMVDEVASRHVDGVGLLRAEFMIAEIGIHPRKIIKDGKQKSFISKLADSMTVFASGFDPRPIIYRATDFKSNEYKNLKGGEHFEEDEANPLLGFRGAYRYIRNPQVFEMELEAIKIVRNKKGFKNLWLMIPFVRTVEEMEQVKKLVSAAGLHRSGTFKLLMMAEIPANVILIDKFLDVGIDGISIGSNDLTMLLLGLDRDNAKISSEFSELDPAVLASMERLITTCKKRKLYSGICGQAPSVYPELTKKLVSWGISSISVSPDLIEKTRLIVHEAERKLVS